MKKRLLILVSILVCCFVMSACNSDAICGNWQTYSCSYLYNGITYEYTIEQAQNLTPNTDVLENPDNYTDKEVVEGTIGLICSQTNGLIYSFKNENVLNIMKDNEINTTLIWEREDDKIIVKSDYEFSENIIYSFEDNNTISTTQTMGNNELKIILKRK